MSHNPEETLRSEFENAGQGHVFAFWDELNPDERSALLSDAKIVDLGEVDYLCRTLLGDSDESAVSLEGLEPAPYVEHPSSGGDPKLWEGMKTIGEDALRAGKVAAFTVAGGQGTRLGYPGPKGTFPVTPIRKKPLFQVFAEKVRAAELRYDSRIPWYIMTSHVNHEATVAFFEENDFFGLSRERVEFFSQGRMPAVDQDGKILMGSTSSIAMNPDGHGGSLRALVRSGAIDRMAATGVEVISYFQVDNPLVNAVDPAFIGFHLNQASDMSSKMVLKAYPLEKLGHFCRQDDRTVVIEYSDLPDEMQEELDESGQLRFRAGSVAIHLLAIDFVRRVTEAGSDTALPFHRAHKKIPTIGPDGEAIQPEAPNGFKFEMFVFDALPFARNPVIIEAKREDEFSPVKNAEGKDSPQKCREDQLRQWARWLESAGAEIEVDSTGLPGFVFEVSPLFATTQDEFVEAWNRLETKPEVAEGLCLE